VIFVRTALFTMENTRLLRFERLEQSNVIADENETIDQVFVR